MKSDSEALVSFFSVSEGELPTNIAPGRHWWHQFPSPCLCLSHHHQTCLCVQSTNSNCKSQPLRQQRKAGAASMILIQYFVKNSINSYVGIASIMIEIPSEYPESALDFRSIKFKPNEEMFRSLFVERC